MTVAAKLFSVLLAAAVTVGWAPATPPTPPTPPAPPASEFLGAVTLITGDHVTVRRVGTHLVPQVTPAPDRHHVHFATTTVGDSLLVVPEDAWSAVRTGRLDQRLFDVTLLLRDGHDDTTSDLPLIVEGPPADGAVVTQSLPAIGATAVRQPKATTADFWATQGKDARIWLDGMRRPSLDVSVPHIGAPTAWDTGLTGTDVRVAVLDTGIDDTHPDLRRQVAVKRNFTTDGPRDTDGHGTHVASTIAGTGKASDGANTGVAPGATLVVGKVCGANGCPESAILAGMDWAVANDATIVNLSLGGPDTAADDPLELAIERLSAQHGTLFVVAAGNDGGYGAETVSSPASADAALAVGAVDDNDVIAGFSGRGPRVADAALKPEITAPGVDIMAARSRFSDLGDRRDRYASLSGTSMATPHVAGAAAILAQQHPDWTGAQLKAALIGSAKPLAGTDIYEQGAGRVDVARSVDQSLYAEPATVSLGRASWPHDDDQAVTRTITYHNPGAQPRTLSLALPVVGPGGEPVPDGMFRLSTPTVTVPAGGTATVDVTANTALPAAEGTFGAHIVATDDTGLRVTTPVAVDREPESYDLTLKTLDAAGKPTDNHYSFVFGLDQLRFRPVPGVDGAGTLRVRAGRYHVDGTINTPRPGETTFDSAKVLHPTVDVRADTTVVIDARSARPVSVTFDRRNVVPEAVAVAYTRDTPHTALSSGVLGDTFDRIGVGQVGDPVPETELVASVGGVWAVPDAQGSLLRSTLSYNLAWFHYGGVPTGFTRHIVDADLAEVRATYRAQADNKRGTKVWIAQEPVADVSNGFGFGFRLPLERTEFHNVGPRWSAELQQWSVKQKQVHTETVLTGGPVDHQPGRPVAESWNSTVFGPGFTDPDESAVRFDDVLAFQLGLFADAGLDRTGLSEVDSGTTVLYRDGDLVGESDQPGAGQFDVPAERATYRLEVTAERSGVSEFSTAISCVWTFASERPVERDKGGTPLPLLAVRFAPPDLTPRNRVTDEKVRIPVTVQQPGPASALTALTVEASFDDGRTWRPVPVTLDGPHTATVEVTHPRGPTYVSLRANATDSAGNSVTQTVIRAYGSR